MTAPFAAVVGWPANHSLSPVMMRGWLEAAGIDGDYGRVEIPEGKAASFFATLPSLGWSGVNITAPHKQAALAAADEVSPAAKAIGAANLLTVVDGGRLHADNTDIIGIAEALAEDDGQSPAVLVGAGGAARAALYHLAQQDREITVVNRTLSKAEALTSQYDRPIRTTSDIESALPGAGLVINATSLGMAGQPKLEPHLSKMAAGGLVFDMVYAPLETPLLRAAKAAGLKIADGLTMLIGQARPSFKAFFREEASASAPIRQILLDHLGATE